MKEEELIGIGDKFYNPEDLTDEVKTLVSDMAYIYNKSVDLESQVAINNLAVENLRAKVDVIIADIKPVEPTE